jgi:hypothetical protein
MQDDTDSGLPRPTEDAVSLHTIADHDVYAAQEQEDADFALALSLEEEEQDRAREVSRLIAQAQEREALIARERAQGSDATPLPYRDNPDDDDGVLLADDDLPPYRDDPEAAVDNVEQQEQALATDEGWRRYIGYVARWMGTLRQRPDVRISKPAKIVVGIALTLLFFFPLLYGISFMFGPSKRSESLPSDKERAFEASGSRNGYLVSAKLYPELEDGASEECKDRQNAWKPRYAKRARDERIDSTWTLFNQDI